MIGGADSQPGFYIIVKVLYCDVRHRRSVHSHFQYLGHIMKYHDNNTMVNRCNHLPTTRSIRVRIVKPHELTL